MREPFVFSNHPNELGFLTIPDEEAVHLTKALRFVTGDVFIAFDGTGLAWRAEIVEISRKAVRAKIIEPLPPEPQGWSITVAVGAVKGPRMDWAVEKAAELGATKFIPLKTRYAMVEPGAGRARRWNNIALAAAKQSRRRLLMQFNPPILIAEIPFQSFSHKLVFDLTEYAIDLRKYPGSEHNESGIPGGILIVIGPEGGFSEEEREMLTTKNVKFISLGLHPLRTETALAAALAIVQAYPVW